MCRYLLNQQKCTKYWPMNHHSCILKCVVVENNDLNSFFPDTLLVDVKFFVIFFGGVGVVS